MAFYKICSCGKTFSFDTPLSFPSFCDNCGRELARVQTFTESEMQSKSISDENKEVSQEPDENLPVEEIATAEGRYYLLLQNGKKIIIPPEGGIIGRTEIGAEELAECPSVSRKHLKVAIHRSLGVSVIDISTYGTYINGKKLNKDEPYKVEAGSKITLCNIDTVFIDKGE